MTKSQKRARAHQERQARQTSVEAGAQGGYEQVSVRTRGEERRHRDSMDRWARAGGGGDFDYSMNG